jgi:hypothetical protein
VTVFTLGQSKADKELNQYLKKHKPDTFILVKTGCQTCEISYEDSLKTIDTITILLLYKKHGQITLVNFSDTGKSQTFDKIKSDIFQFVAAKRDILKQAENYYKEQKHLKFQAPCLATFPYEKIQIQIGQFRHRNTIVAREMDDCGSYLTNEKWFKTELEILNLVENIK